MKKILLVEGINDKSVIDQVLKAYGIEVDWEIKVCGGVDNLADELPLYIKNPTAYSIIGVVADADSSTLSRWQQIRNILHNTGMYNCSRLPLPHEGIVVVPMELENAPKVGAWVMPNNEHNGTLEDFLLEMVPANDELMIEVEKKLSDVEAQGKHRYPSKYQNKAKVQTFLAWERKPGISVATAVASHIFNPYTPTADKFIEWVKGVFEVNQ